MAIWWQKSISLLKSPLFLGLFIVQCLMIGGIQFVFYRIEIDQSKTVTAAIGSLLRDESTLSKSYLIAQSLEDMTAYGAIKCAKLSMKTGNNSIAFYDSTFRPDCPSASLVGVNLTGVDGNSWDFQLVPNIGPLFYVLKWTLFFLAAALLTGIYFVGKSMIDTEKKKHEAAESQRMLLQNLAKQVTHDVASPIGALKIIADAAVLDTETRDFLKSAVLRAESIFDTLRRQEVPDTTFQLDSELKDLIREKETSVPSFPKVSHDVSSLTIRFPRTEFGRIISNILNNSFESGAKHVGIRLQKNSEFLSLVIADDGAPIPESVIAKLGSRNNTSGKANGQGLGLYHAYEVMSSTGGAIVLSNVPTEKVTLRFPLSRVQAEKHRPLG